MSTRNRRPLRAADFWFPLALIAVATVVGLWTGSARAENKVLTWVNAPQNTDGTAIPATGPGSLTRTTVEYGTCNGTLFGTKAGEIFVAAPAQTLTVNLVVVQQYCLRAFHTNTFGAVSGFSNVATTTVAPPTPGTPSNLTVTSTRIESSEWTCRDASGAILTAHVRQDKAQESCTNYALASLGTPYEMRPSGYRIVAR